MPQLNVSANPNDPAATPIITVDTGSNTPSQFSVGSVDTVALFAPAAGTDTPIAVPFKTKPLPVKSKSSCLLYFSSFTSAVCILVAIGMLVELYYRDKTDVMSLLDLSQDDADTACGITFGISGTLASFAGAYAIFKYHEAKKAALPESSPTAANGYGTFPLLARPD